MSSCLDSGCACVPRFSSQTCGILITTVPPPPPLLLSNIYRRFHSLCRDAGPLARLCLSRRLCRAPRASSPYLLGLVSRGGEAATLTTTGAPPASPCPPPTHPQQQQLRHTWKMKASQPTPQLCWNKHHLNHLLLLKIHSHEVIARLYFSLLATVSGGWWSGFRSYQTPTRKCDGATNRKEQNVLPVCQQRYTGQIPISLAPTHTHTHTRSRNIFFCWTFGAANCQERQRPYEQITRRQRIHPNAGPRGVEGTLCSLNPCMHIERMAAATRTARRHTLSSHRAF